MKFKYRSNLGALVSTFDTYVDSRDTRNQFAATEEYLKRIREIVPVTLVLVPDRYRYDPRLRAFAVAAMKRYGIAENQIDFNLESRLLKELSTRLKIDYVDPIDKFRSYPEPEKLSYLINGHTTEIGNRLIADAVLEQLGRPGNNEAVESRCVR